MGKIISAVVKYIKQTDRILLLFSVIAGIYGLIMVYSATLFVNRGQQITRTFLVQVVGNILGIILMIIMSKIDYHTFAAFWKYIAAAGILLLMYTLIFGFGRAGSEDKSWISVFGLTTIQPAELIKIAFIITFSKHFDMVKENLSSPLNVFLLGVHAAIPIGIIVLQKDMGMALVYVCIFIFMIFSTPIKMRYFAGGGIALLIAAPFIWNKVFGGTQRNRILALFDPTNPKFAEKMFQQNQGVSALASGEIWGYGLFNGPKTQSLYASSLPERQNDMIFTVVGEELGLIGCIALLFILIVILIRFIVVSASSKDEMGSMICIGAFASFAVQMIINIGMCLRVLPVVGLALPFFSSGGSTTVSSFMTVGLVMSVYLHRKSLLFGNQDEN
ncbi:MAG TPA: FtsW/RodA/SpoVE family cell cycle protein [Ruminiclostridium sp.]|nr:FtsW/RodA/SpoVE family cell cycle protein [Ruminiclostridium sp.]